MDQVLGSERSGNQITVAPVTKKISTSSTGGSQERPIKYHIKQ